MLGHISRECVTQRVYRDPGDPRTKTRKFEIVAEGPIAMSQRDWIGLQEVIRTVIQRHALATGLAINKPDDFTITIKVKVTDHFTDPQAGERKNYKHAVGGPFTEFDKKSAEFPVR